MDYGQVKEWKNDTTWFFITNVSKSKWFVLPTFYNQEFLLLSPTGAVLPGQKIRIGVSYYTESTGKFELEIPFYISSEISPILLHIKGKILDFHPLALIYCPNLDPKKPSDKVFLVDIENDIDSLEERREEKTILVEEVVIEEIEEVVIEVIQQIDTISLKEVTKKDSSEKLLVNQHVSVEQDIRKEEEKREEKKEEVVEEEVDTLDILKVEEEDSRLSSDYAINNIVFLIDISGSMAKQNKLESLKASMKELVWSLRPEDKISIITYATRAKVLFKASDFVNMDSLFLLIDSLKANGHSYGKDGLDMAYALALDEFIVDGNNTVLLATDGKFNYKDFSENRLYKQAAKMSFKRVKISVVGFGRDKKALNFLNKLARFGRGDFVHVTPDNRDSSVLLKLIKKMSFLE